MLKRICQVCVWDQSYLCSGEPYLLLLFWTVDLRFRASILHAVFWAFHAFHHLHALPVFLFSFFFLRVSPFRRLCTCFKKKKKTSMKLHAMAHLFVSLSSFSSNQKWPVPGGSQRGDPTWEHFSGVQTCRHLCSIKMLIISPAISSAILL